MNIDEHSRNGEQQSEPTMRKSLLGLLAEWEPLDEELPDIDGDLELIEEIAP